MKLEVGMYVRTKKGIARITELNSDGNIAYTDNKNIFFGAYRPVGKIDFVLYDDGTVLKVSHNIIDLIEVGDYVNGHKITEVIDGLEKCLKTEYKFNLTYIHFYFYENTIKSIVTKEQMESMRYVINEN